MNPEIDRSLFIGTMTGTSMDGLDIVAVSFDCEDQPLLQAQQQVAYPNDLQQQLFELATDESATVSQMCRLNTLLGQFYARHINQFINENHLDKRNISAIASHGQTIRHSVDSPLPYTFQIGDPNIIAALTDVPVVADFRRKDIALGGQGAPLAPAFHNHAFRSSEYNRVIINIGGITNITCLPCDPSAPISGFDTGPGNILMDYLSQQVLDAKYDNRGEFAQSGRILTHHLERLLRQEAYFQRSAPKSTGTDYFSPRWLQNSGLLDEDPANAMATLVELVAISLTDAIKGLTIAIDECYVCGGGAHNNYLMQRIANRLSGCTVSTTEALGTHPDWVEAVAFAWIARQTLNRQPANQPSVTGAKKLTILGAVHY